MDKINFCNQDLLGTVAAESFLKHQKNKDAIKLAACWLAGFTVSLAFVGIF